MGCRCGQGNKVIRSKVSMAARPVISQTPRTPIQTIKNELKFCDKCGWMMAKVSYVDVNTKQRIQKYSCPNHQCPNYNK
jgi:ribosomal protein L37AE/L43A